MEFIRYCPDDKSNYTFDENEHKIGTRYICVQNMMKIRSLL